MKQAQCQRQTAVDLFELTCLSESLAVQRRSASVARLHRLSRCHDSCDKSTWQLTTANCRCQTL